MSEQEIVAGALRRDVAERPAYLDRACGRDLGLRRRVERRMAGDGTTGDTPPGPESSGVTADYEPTADRPGASIGPYKLLQAIGEGGFGVVYMAEQEGSIRRM